MRVDPATIPVPEMPLIGETFAVELANSRYLGEHEDVDFLEHPEAVAIWFENSAHLSDLAVPPGLDAAAAAALRETRDATRLLLTQLADGSPALSEAAAEVLHRASGHAPGHVSLNVDDPRHPTWELHHEGDPDDVFLASVATRCIVFLAGEEATRVRRCVRPGCPLLFTQHHRTRRYCSEYCARKERQARYYQATKQRRGTT